MNEQSSQRSTRSIRVWDLPVRVVHWAFVLLIPALWWTNESGNMFWHLRLGYVMLALIFFRIYWGFFGGSTARFTSFVRGPSAVWSYVRQRETWTGIGHNPLGALSVLLLLGLLAIQVGLGLFSEDTDGIVSGPLAGYVSYEAGERATETHEFLFNVILAAIALHIAAILFYLFAKRDNLVRPMITGRKGVDGELEGAVPAPLWRLAMGIILSLALTWWISAGAPLPS